MATPPAHRPSRPVALQALLLAAGVAAYAAAVYCSSQQTPALSLLLAVLPLAWLAAAFGASAPAGPRWRRWARWLPLVLLGAGLVLFWPHLVANFRLLYLLQHVGIHAALAWLFAASLRPGRTPLCTELASWVHEDITVPRLMWYTRQVTWAWALFFAAMVLASLAVYALASPGAWTFFSAVLGPLLTAAMFLVENLARTYFLPPQHRLGLASTWRAVNARVAGKPRLPHTDPP
ncbi:MAG: hypothetical protein Q4G71_03355 [Pseudomonadota bacterium]|nr:hypothetical protein [Pseudomonadota bacterium]